jgi:hypothetical protein
MQYGHQAVAGWINKSIGLFIGTTYRNIVLYSPIYSRLGTTPGTRNIVITSPRHYPGTRR